MRKRIAAAVLAACLIAVPVLDRMPVQAADQAEELKAEKSRLEDELAAVQETVDGLESRHRTLKSALNDLQADGRAMQDEYDQLTKEMANASELVAAAIQTSADAVENVKAQQTAYETRLTTLFQYRSKSTLEVLLESDSLDGFFTNMRLMRYVADADQQLLTNLQIAREDAEAKQAEAESTVAVYSAFIDEKQKQLDLLAEGISLVEQDLDTNDAELSENSAKAEDLQLDILAYDSRLTAFYEEQRRLQAEAAAARAAAEAEREAAARRQASEQASIRASQEEASSIAQSKADAAREAAESLRRQAEENPDDSGIQESANDAEASASSLASEATTTESAETSSTVPTVEEEPAQGRLIHPLTSYHYVSSPYGPRVHPITGDVNGFHWGVDFSADFGTPIRACKAGTVALADASYQGQRYTSHKSGLGNFVTIRHDDGTATTYAHMMYVEASVGQRVSAGERIGQVGSTGASTGAHLHLEYSIYGETVDPLPYID